MDFTTKGPKQQDKQLTPGIPNIETIFRLIALRCFTTETESELVLALVFNSKPFLPPNISHKTTQFLGLSLFPCEKLPQTGMA